MISKAVLLSLASVIFAAPAFAQDAERDRNAFTINALYKGDVMGVASGGVAHGVRFLDNIDVVADADLEAAFHWKRATAHFPFLTIWAVGPTIWPDRSRGSTISRSPKAG
ncbi:hypothetical protein [Sphingomonas paucimobilis]|uniref:hypothetical protein n=1 Tax=Sphingomonas paucimobilis TaxID=13689 RepID=UPI00242E2D9C|nr:hypothetical protein [Sphingomonas paucimobilis]